MEKKRELHWLDIVFYIFGSIFILSVIVFGVAVYIDKDSASITGVIREDIEEYKYQKAREFMENGVVFDEVVIGGEVIYNTPEIKKVYDELKLKIKEVKELEGIKNRLRESQFEEILELSTQKSMQVVFVSNKSFDIMYENLITIFKNKYDLTYDRATDNKEYIQTVQELVNNNYIGDCDDYALFFFVLAKKKGLEVRYVLSSAHLWIQIKKGNNWIEYDSTSNKICKSCITDSFDGEVKYIYIN